MQVVMNTAMLVGMAAMLGLVTILPSEPNDPFFLRAVPFIALIMAVVGLPVLARHIVGPMLRQTRIRLDEDRKSLVLDIHLEERLILLNTVNKIVRICDPDGRTLSITLYYDLGRARLIGFEHMERLFNIVSRLVQRKTIVITKTQRCGKEKWFAREGWFMLAIIAVAFVLFRVPLEAFHPGETGFSIVGIVLFAGLTACVWYYHSRSGKTDRLFFRVTLMFWIMVAVALLADLFWL